MRTSVWLWVFAAIVSAGLCSCGSNNFKELTAPVTGTVLVDGEPAAGVAVNAVSRAPDKTNPTYSMAETDAQGKFSLQTYNPGDGIPPGEYDLTFVWLEKQGRNPKDMLGGRYKDPAKTVKTIKVEQEPFDIGTIELTTK